MSAGGWSAGWPAILPAAGFALTLPLGVFVWSRRGNPPLQRSLAALNLLVALWNLDVLLLFAAPDARTAEVLDRLFQTPIIALPLAALVFFFVFLGRPLRDPLLAGFGAWAALLALASLGPHYLTGWRRFWFGWYGTPGALYPLFVAYLVAYLCVSTRLLAREARAAGEEQRRRQARLLFAANLFLGLSSLTNFLPLWGVPFLPLGNVACVAYVFVIGVAIFRHRLLDAQVLFRAGMLYSTLTLLLTTVYFALVLGLQRWAQDEVFAGSLVLPMLPAFAAGLAAGPLKASLQERLDRTFFRSRAEMRARLEALPAALGRLEREEELWVAAWEEGWRHAHPERGLVVRCAQGAFTVAAGAPAAGGGPPADAADAAGALLAGLGSARLLPDAGAFEVAVPVVGREGLLGGCLLGARQSGEPWRGDDLGFLDAVAGQTALAVERARLRERVGREGRLAALGRMAGVVSHELRNPLNNISCALRVLRLQHQAVAGSPEIGVVEAEISRGNRFINDVLGACREQRLRLVPIDLAISLRDFAARWAGGGALELEAPPAGLWVSGDAFRLRQVFENLARNAVEACGDAGSVLVRAERPGDGGVAVWFLDDGPGIDPGLLPTIFEPFQTTRGKGTGLGLSIARGIVEAHGGSIGGANRPGGGAVFRVWLPAAPETPMSPPTPRRALP